MITASAIAASREQTSPAPPRLLDVPQQAATERGHSVETIRAYVDWTTRFILFHGKRHPRDLTNAEVGRFLGHLRSRGTVVCRGAGDGHRQEQPQHVHHDMLLPSLEPLAPVIAVRAADGEFASDRRRPYSSGGKRPSNRRFSRSITRDGSLMFKTCTVTLPQKVLPTKIALSQRKCRFQLCFRGLNRG